MTSPTARSRFAGVVGQPVAHSLSPVIQNAALAHDGVDAVYLAFAVDDDPRAFRVAVRGLAAAGCVGVNVTIPFKAAAARVAAVGSEEVDATGAANVLRFGASIEAFNTDVAGVQRALEDIGAQTAGRTVLLLGAGGAAAAACLAVSRSGADRIVLANRTRRRAGRLAQRLGVEVVSWDERGDAASGARVIVNATSVGMDGASSPLDLSTAAEGTVVLDLVYRPDETPLVVAARRRGLRAADGLGMLVHQAAEAYSLFWGRPAPLDAMRTAAWGAVGRTSGP